MTEVRVVTVGDDEFKLEVRKAFGTRADDDEWTITVRGRNGMGGHNLLPVVGDRGVVGLDRAVELATKVAALLRPHVLAAQDREDKAFEEFAQREDARLAETRKAMVKRREDARKRPKVEAWECGNCGHLTDDPADFEGAVYECSRCGNEQGEADGNRCENCHIFMARVADRSCPECHDMEEPFKVTARRMKDRTLEVLDEDNPPQATKTATKVAPVVDLAPHGGGG